MKLLGVKKNNIGLKKFFFLLLLRFCSEILVLPTQANCHKDKSMLKSNRKTLIKIKKNVFCQVYLYIFDF